MENMDHNAHSVYLMYYHLIMVVKYRRKVINDPISERAKEIWEYIAPRYGIVLEEWNHDIDHVHVMFRAHGQYHDSILPEQFHTVGQYIPIFPLLFLKSDH